MKSLAYMLSSHVKVKNTVKAPPKSNIKTSKNKEVSFEEIYEKLKESRKGMERAFHLNKKIEEAIKNLNNVIKNFSSPDAKSAADDSGKLKNEATPQLKKDALEVKNVLKGREERIEINSAKTERLKIDLKTSGKALNESMKASGKDEKDEAVLPQNLKSSSVKSKVRLARVIDELNKSVNKKIEGDPNKAEMKLKEKGVKVTSQKKSESSFKFSIESIAQDLKKGNASESFKKAPERAENIINSTPKSKASVASIEKKINENVKSIKMNPEIKGRVQTKLLSTGKEIHVKEEKAAKPVKNMTISNTPLTFNSKQDLTGQITVNNEIKEKDNISSLVSKDIKISLKHTNVNGIKSSEGFGVYIYENILSALKTLAEKVDVFIGDFEPKVEKKKSAAVEKLLKIQVAKEKVEKLNSPENRIKSSEPKKISTLTIRIERLRKQPKVMKNDLYRLKRVEAKAESVNKMINSKKAVSGYKIKDKGVINTAVDKLQMNMEKNSGVHMTNITRVDVEQMIDRVQRIVNSNANRPSFREVAQMRLVPPDLGRVEVEIVKEDSKLQIIFRVETTEAKELIEKKIDHLSERLGAQGFVVDKMEVKVEKNYQEENRQWQEEHGEQRSGQEKNNKEGKKERGERNDDEQS